MVRFSRYLLVLLGLCLFVTAGTAQKERGVKVKTRESSEKFEGTVYDNMWAVVIGIDKYRHWERLEYAVNDARAVKSLLISKFGFRSDRIIELMDQEATLVNIRTTLGGVLPQKAKKNDGVFIFFAGHGETVDLPDGGNLGYIVPVDGSTDKSEYFASLLPMTQVREICNLIPAKHIFFVVDACYSGLAASAERGMSSETKLFVGKLATLKSRQILTAGGRGEPVIEKSEWGHSAFTYKFLEALESGAADVDNDGIMTAGEIGTYIRTRVPRITDNRQSPQFKNLTNDEGEFIFISTDSPAKASSVLPAPRGVSSSGEDELKKELERLKAENERLKHEKQQAPQQPDKQTTKKKEEKKDVIVIPPP